MIVHTTTGRTVSWPRSRRTAQTSSVIKPNRNQTSSATAAPTETANPPSAPRNPYAGISGGR